MTDKIKPVKSSQQKKTPPQWYVYILRCEGGELYTGITTDVKRRFAEHKNGLCKGAKYTRTHPPVSVAAVFDAKDRSEASRLEYAIKKLTKKEKEMLITAPERIEDMRG